ncbi:MAG: endonuclease V [Candidatus Aminicenantaceae bacterium]
MESQLNLERLAKLQERLASKVSLVPDIHKVNFIAGADFNYDKKEKYVGASIVIYKIPEFEIVEISQTTRKVRIPYIPTFLAFREGPVFFDAFRRIKKKPDVTLIDGNGIAHPRKMGLATYGGVILDIVTIGCAKNPFFLYTIPQNDKGAYTFFMNDKSEKVGLCLRTKKGAKPIFVSPGHRIDIMTSMKLVLSCSKYRIPEPLREAHRLANQMFSTD